MMERLRMENVDVSRTDPWSISDPGEPAAKSADDF